ncbi:MAG: glycosyltransferase [Reichenbachiella sp.]|uniref:glycosyltransferase family 2 protein n=1 Tax=Reichenbachiella sp. TaxID=2184521 RepID=UPI003265CEA1
MNNPLVSVICLCYNQQKFLCEALDSVQNQTYDNIQLIIVDDASTDGSKERIKSWLSGKSDVPFLDHSVNLGSTTAFNTGLALASGDYIIDLAADDVLCLDRVEKQVRFFETLGHEVGVIYSDAMYINADSEPQALHFDQSRLVSHVGDIYADVIDTYFIPTPTMMMRREVLDELQGYDESLAYEDFDFWVRSARNWQYQYQSDVLTKIRKSQWSYSTNWYKKGDPQLYSTYLICLKIRDLNRSQEENIALLNRIRFEMRQSFLSGNHREFDLFHLLYTDLGESSWIYTLLKILNRLKLNFSIVRSFYHKLRFG